MKNRRMKDERIKERKKKMIANSKKMKKIGMKIDGRMKKQE